MTKCSHARCNLQAAALNGLAEHLAALSCAQKIVDHGNESDKRYLPKCSLQPQELVLNNASIVEEVHILAQCPVRNSR
ncbi:hypothetical protein GJ496_011871 [Pomphorhynchus laevis]|nr:hypothetical protein GJ496_011871 [Pomphorhynchus laevis]